MSCCGGNRAAQRNVYQTSLSMPSRSAAPASRSAASAKIVHFEYTGMTAISVTGPATGSTYRFDRRGARLAVHGTDAPSLLAVPGLRPVG